MASYISKSADMSVSTKEKEQAVVSASGDGFSQADRNGRVGFFRRSALHLTALLEPGKQKSTIPSLDGVRAIACLLVVGYHINLITRDTHIWLPENNPFIAALLQSGESGVTLFFVLSGFLLFLPYARALLLKQNWPSMRRFYLRRALRIIPAYYICLVALIFLMHREYLQADRWPQLVLFLTFFMDSSVATFQAINGPFWTLAVEWQFYLLLPLLVLGMRALAWHCSPRKRLWTILLCLCTVIAWGMLSQFWLEYLRGHPLPGTPVWYIVSGLFLGQGGKYLQDFALGMLVSLLYVYTRYADSQERVKEVLRRLQLWLWGAGTALFLFITLWRENSAHGNGMPWLDGVRGYYSLLGEAGFACAFCLCLCALLFGNPASQKIFSWLPLRWIGHLSYSTYMWHFPLLIFFMVHVGYNITDWNLWLVFASYWLWIILAILPFSLVTFLLTERPGMQLSSKL